jgi:Glycosyl hydrolase family 26
MGYAPRAHRVARHFLAIMVSFMIVLGADSAADATESRTPSLYWGAWIGAGDGYGEAPWDFTGVHRFEQTTGKSVSLVHFGSPLLDCRAVCHWLDLPTEQFDRIRAHGAIPFFSWSTAAIPLGPDQPAFTSRAVISGRYDAQIWRVAHSARRWRHPFFVRLNHEMNTTVFPWSFRANGNKKGDYAKAWRRVWRIFRRAGADNATWVWCPHADSSLTTAHLRSLYPGDRYVDWTCIDTYNWYPPYRSFEQIALKYYRTITRRIAPAKPMVIGEAGSLEFGGNKARWFDDLGRTLRRYSKIRAFVYFEVNTGSEDWRVTTSPSSIDAFRRLVGDRRFVGNEFARLDTKSIPPP